MQNGLKSMNGVLRQNPALYQQIKSLTPIVANGFATNDLVAKNYIKFKQRYTESVKSFQEKLSKVEDEDRPALKKPVSKAYTHPYNSHHHPLNFSPVKNAELFHDWVGPEQVSPHYENFMMSRKYALIFWGGVFALSFGASTVDLHWMAKSSIIPFVFWMQLHYFYLEGRKSMLKPLLIRFYRRVAAHDIYNFNVFYHENIEVKLRELLRISKTQLEYWQLHKEFQDIKAESINNFLANEYINLQRHITDRAVNILKQAQAYEEINKNRYVQGMIDEASAEVDKAVNGPNKEAIQKSMLESAIKGLAKGYMDYEGDPILPLVQGAIKRNVEKFSKLNDVEQKRLLALTESQLQSLKDSDKRVREEYVHSEPKGLDASLKANEIVKKLLTNWGK